GKSPRPKGLGWSTRWIGIRVVFSSAGGRRTFSRPSFPPPLFHPPPPAEPNTAPPRFLFFFWVSRLRTRSLTQGGRRFVYIIHTHLPGPRGDLDGSSLLRFPDVPRFVGTSERGNDETKPPHSQGLRSSTNKCKKKEVEGPRIPVASPTYAATV